jgi:drug/metabolite transporter (DMT)-like permease
MRKAFLLGLAGSFFFASTFVLNRSMNLSGGHWIWSASLRYFFTLPLLALIVMRRRGFESVHRAIAKSPRAWFLWSTVGFGLFYAPICYAASHGETWLIAASWQTTIVMGILMAPLFQKKIPLKNLAASGVILAGVFLTQGSGAKRLEAGGLAATLLPILVAAVAYPLGNRKMMALSGDLNTIERTYGMTLCSMPFWVVLALAGIPLAGPPAAPQLIQTFLVALSSGVVATLMFFKATDLVKSNQKQLAVVESTQAGELVFALLGGVLLLGDALPSPAGFVGIAVIACGMVLNSLLSA